jgi:DNA-binding FadR family transcriptional regulator
MVQSLHKENLSQKFVRVFAEMIVKQELPPASRIASEAEIAEQFGISRSVVREGIRELSAIGLITKSQGRTSMIAPKEQWKVLNPILLVTLLEHDPDHKEILNDLLNYRLLIECQAAADAALRWTEADLACLEEHLRQLEQNLENVEQFVQIDFLFHADIHIAAHNLILSSTLQSIGDIILLAEEPAHSFYPAPNNLPSHLSPGCRSRPKGNARPPLVEHRR